MRAWPELRNAQEGPHGSAARKGGFGARRWKAEAVSEAEAIKEFIARAIGGDAAGYERARKVFEICNGGRVREKGRGARKKEGAGTTTL